MPIVSGANALWPFAGQPHAKNHQFGLYAAELGDSFLNRMLKQNVTPEDAVARYLALDVNAMVNLDRLLEINLDQQRRRDELTDYRFADVISDRFRSEYLFLTPYHPNLWMARHWAAEVFRQIEVGEDAIAQLEQGLSRAPFPQVAAPIHPSVIRHFGLCFLPEEPRYHLGYEGNVTFTEFATRYMRYDWNEDLSKGSALALAGKLEAAEARLRLGLERAPSSVDGLRTLTTLLGRARRHDEAVAVMQRAVVFDPNDPGLQALFAAVLQDAGKLNEAEVAVRRAIALEPRRVLFRSRLSKVLAAANRLDDALEEAKKAVTLDPRNPEIQTDLGLCLLGWVGLEEAEAAIRQAIEIAPWNWMTIMQLVNALERQGKLEEASKAALRAMELNPKWANPRIRLVRLLERTGQATEAEAVLRQAIEALPDTAVLYHELSYLLERRGDLDGAVQAASRALALDASEVAFHVHYSQLLARQDNVEAAIEAARRAVMLRPQGPGLHGHLSQLLTRAGRLDEAEAVIRQAIELAPENSRRLPTSKPSAGAPGQAG